MKAFGTRFAGLFAALGLLAFSVAARAADEHVGPHKGIAVEWGEEEYHLEFVPDAKAGTVTVYVYGDHKEFHKGVAKPIDATQLVLTLKTKPSVTVKLEPKPDEKDPKGKSSVYVAKHDVFKKEMKFEGTISGKVGTKPYSGDFKQK